jgi:hypothetical protein
MDKDFYASDLDAIAVIDTSVDVEWNARHRV